MAVQNETVSSFTDLITKLDTYFQTIGWTAEHLDTTTTAVTGGEWAMLRTGTNLRFATSWDANVTPNSLAIYQYVDQVYDNTVRPWEQDNDSGNGYAGKAEASIIGERHVIIGSTPIQYWAFSPENTDDYTYVVVETAEGVYCHFGFGILDKRGDWTGGEFVYGQRNYLGNITNGTIMVDGVSFLLDGFINDTAQNGGPANGAELLAATIHCEGLPNQPANGQWAVSCGGSHSSPQTDFGKDRQSNDGVSTDTDRVMFIDGLRAGAFASLGSRTSGTDLGGEQRMWPIAVRYYDSTTEDTYGPMGFMPDAFGCNIANGRLAGDVITDEEGDQYYIFPAHTRWETGAGTSGYLGIAYRVSTYVDPGAPAVADDPVAWYSTRSSDDYTLSGSEVTQLDDKTTNGNDLTVPGGDTGPTLTEISGRNWMSFPSGQDYRLSGANTDVDPGTSKGQTCIVVYRSDCPGSPAGCATGKYSATANFGIFFAVSDTDSMYAQLGRSGSTTQTVEHNPTTFDYNDGTTRLAMYIFDVSTDDMYLFGDDPSDMTTAVDSDTSDIIGDVTPGANLMIGDWRNDGTSERPFEGEIAEVVYFDYDLSTAQREAWEDYLRTKWDIP